MVAISFVYIRPTVSREMSRSLRARSNGTYLLAVVPSCEGVAWLRLGH